MSRHRAFPDRRTAGLHLGQRLREWEWTDPLVLGLARGGVVVAHAVAEILDVPLDVEVARKIGAPGRPELGVGAVTASGQPTFDDRTLRALDLVPADLVTTCERERQEARRREELYLDGRERRPRTGRDVIVVDDGLATGVTARAGLRAVRGDRPRGLVFAAPVCAPDAVVGLKGDADEVVCLLEPRTFRAVGEWYADFGQTTDDEVIELLATG